MSSTDNELPTSGKSKLPKATVNAIARLRSLGSSFKGRRNPGPVVFPPPSWDLDDNRTGQNVIYESTQVPEIPLTEAPPDLSEPVTFAKKIETLIESLPAGGSSTINHSGISTGSESGKVLSPEPVPPELDNDLVRMLASEDVMNGGRATSRDGTSKNKSNIWDILAGLKKGSKNDVGSSEATPVEEDGFMMYAPLEPKEDSKIELAMPVPQSVEGRTPGPSISTTGPIVEKHGWVPSTTNLSLLTTWWGYRMYLPPAVMAKLDNKAIKATARAAMIATALKWLLEKIPLLIIPPQFRPIVKLLKQLGPLTGYIGVFIAWSWDRVCSLDEGNGVVLTATWLLPVALLPMAWDAGDIYRPILPPKPEELKAIQEAAAKAAEEERKAAEKAKNTASLDQKHQKGERKKSLFRW